MNVNTNLYQKCKRQGQSYAKVTEERICTTPVWPDFQQPRSWCKKLPHKPLLKTYLKLKVRSAVSAQVQKNTAPTFRQEQLPHCSLQRTRMAFSHRCFPVHCQQVTPSCPLPTIANCVSTAHFVPFFSAKNTF